jgi:hypothetical protein
MEKLKSALFDYAHACYPLGHSTEKIIIGERPFYLILDDDTGENLTVKSFIEKYYPEGKSLEIDGDFYVLCDFKKVIFIKCEVWEEYNLSEMSDEYIIVLDEESSIVNIKEKFEA